MKKTPFIVLDGQDGSGKGTQIRLLLERCQKESREVFSTREPGGAKLSEWIREVFISPEGAESSALTQFLLVWAARSHWIREVVIPKLMLGVPVLADRSDSSTFAYQLFAKQAPELEEEFWRMRKTVFGDHIPTLYLIVDVPAEEAKRRVDADKSREKSTFDLKPIEWYEQVREGFHAFAKALPSQVIIVDGTRAPEIIHEEIYDIVGKHCGW